MLKENRSNSVTNIRQLFRDEAVSLTLRDIKTKLPNLKASEISMTLCYLLKQRYVIRELIENKNPKERKHVYVYTYSDDRYPQVQA